MRRYFFDARLQATKDFSELAFDGRASAIGATLRTLAERYRKVNRETPNRVPSLGAAFGRFWLGRVAERRPQRPCRQTSGKEVVQRSGDSWLALQAREKLVNLVGREESE